jgi:hypothetical protein
MPQYKVTLVELIDRTSKTWNFVVDQMGQDYLYKDSKDPLIVFKNIKPPKCYVFKVHNLVRYELEEIPAVQTAEEKKDRFWEDMIPDRQHTAAAPLTLFAPLPTRDHASGWGDMIGTHDNVADEVGRTFYQNKQAQRIGEMQMDLDKKKMEVTRLETDLTALRNKVRREGEDES